MKKRGIVKYSDRIKVSPACKVVNFGRYNEIERDEIQLEQTVDVVKTIDERTFYYLYFSIMNVTTLKKMTDGQMMLMCEIMCKPLDFNLPVDSKDGKLTEIANELSTEEQVKTPNGIYQAVKRMKDSGFLVETEDRLLVPCAELQKIRIAIKKQFELQGFATFDYLFKCVISNE